MSLHVPAPSVLSLLLSSPMFRLIPADVVHHTMRVACEWGNCGGGGGRCSCGRMEEERGMLESETV